MQAQISTQVSAPKNVSVMRIKPSGTWLKPDFGEIWAYRELLYFFAWRDVKVRYKQTALGVLWVLLQPVLTTLIFTILFARFAPSTNDKISYPLFAFAGFVLWSFTSNALGNSINSMVNYSDLITKVYFPRLMMPLSAICATLFDLALSLILLLAVLLISGVGFSWKIIFAPFFVLLLTMFVFGLGTLLSAVNVRFRDVRFVLPFALQLLMFATPVFYSLDFLPERWRTVWKLNPLAGILEGFRASIFGTEFDVAAVAISIVVTILLAALALYVFRQMEDTFADTI